ncbi:glycoside hydrolase family 125 protein [Enterococcus faecium]|uniref:glycoside hydrolase family 125 protein n=1 Tax=Enterococcus faecium TaxID=1352 RepID=UPI001E2ED77D|nr:glycoside hydrolase family 125 protein [Enterococcus faecium]MCB8537261.1 glycoside hydrolase family 125 protein [Enterococcus faecium]MCB8539644.1 glycoside hydrolase family 125 protein [Enterococcus faecium]
MVFISNRKRGNRVIDQEKLIIEIKEYVEKINLFDKKVTNLFRQAIVDTISNTITVKENGEIFVSTGDIPAMWLRDSTFQVFPYLELVEEIPSIKQLIHGVIKQQLSYLLHDPYANAFNMEENGQHYSNDQSNIPISSLVWERKFEIDSLCAPFFLAYHLYQTGYNKHIDKDFWKSVELVVDIFITEQRHEQSEYRFQRSDCPFSDTLQNDGKGTPIHYTGMVWSGFRPSDDACLYGYFIPGNCFILVILDQLLDLLSNNKQENLKEKIIQLKSEISAGIKRYGLMTDQSGKFYYAYEVDGLGNQLFMDDANVPSLLSLPFLGYCKEHDPIYLNTREKCLSNQNPYYYSGNYLTGVGSPHTPPQYVWPISIAMEGLTTTNISMVKEKITKIATTDAQTNQCHEGIDVNDPNHYTREWFSWSNMTYCQLVFHYMKLVGEK